jgi:hypothetical protein
MRPTAARIIFHRSPDVTLPNYLLIGVPKAGTSSLQVYLGQHPDVFAAWEPRFLHFAGLELDPGDEDRREFRVTTPAAYEALFSGQEHRTARIDRSPSYFAYPEPSIAGIRQYVPDAKFIAIYRQPADRGYSDYMMQVTLGQEPCRSYADALGMEREGRRRDNGQWRHYFRHGFYAGPTRKFLDAFPRERFLFLLYDDLVRDAGGVIRSIFQFLGVDPDFQPDMGRRYMVGRWPKHFRLHRLLNSKRSPVRWTEKILSRRIHKAVMRRVNALNLGRPPRLDPGLRRELTGKYREDILRVQDMIGRDLSGWLA